MASKKYPYRGESVGLSDFGESLTVQSELASTQIDTILHRFQITGVLPQVGRVALPADVYFGGEDFQSLQNKLSEAQAHGVSEDDLNSSNEENNEDEHEPSNVDTASGEHGASGGVEASNASGESN